MCVNCVSTPKTHCAKRQTEGTRKSKRQAKKAKKEPVKVIVQSAPEDDLEESEQPPSGSEPDVNRGDDEESAQPSAGSEPDVNTQEVEGNEDSESNEGRDIDTEYSDATYPSLSTRATPYQLTKHLQNLTDAQSQSLREMGFDHLREQQISRVPGKLAWWLLNNFDARSCSLRVHDGKELHITEEDVALTLGFPRGNIRIEKRTKGDEDTTLLDDWKKQLRRTNLLITPTKLCKAMVACKDGGEWFKRHLAILVSIMFVESNLAGYVNTNLIKNFEDVTKIGNLNWCEYIRRTLVSSKVAWTQKTAQKFIGPIIFLTIFYVDRVVLYSRSLPRQLPAIIGWTTKLLNQREKNEISSGGFGYGYIDGPLQPLKAIEEKKSAESEEGLEMVESAQKLLGIPNPEIELTQENEEFWNNPEFIAAFDEIDNAIARREQYRAKIAEGPSFSLGMTPDEVERQTTTEELTTPAEQQEKVDETEKSLGKQQTTIEELTALAEQQDDVDEMQPPEPQQKESQQIEQDDEEQDPIQMQTEKSLGKEPQRLETRKEKRQVKPTNPLKSPYLTRQVDMKRPWTATEKIIGKWVLQNDNVYPTRIIFKHGPYAVIWDDMLSLNKNQEIKVGIIDAWSAILNQKEKTRSSSSPCKFFASTFVCFVFPIVHSQHYFVLTVNVKNKRFDILDNSSSDSLGNEKYGDVPTTLKTMLAEYFHTKEDDAKSNLVKALTPARLRMSWRDNSNKVDCGVFTMRHMETYMGKGTKGWDCGLEKENKERLNNARVKYLAEIVNSPVNEFRGDCMKDARQFENASKAKK
nr:uncharacterized protein LOC109155335 [Ipomoea trifida]